MQIVYLDTPIPLKNGVFVLLLKERCDALRAEIEHQNVARHQQLDDLESSIGLEYVDVSCRRFHGRSLIETFHSFHSCGECACQATDSRSTH